MDWKKILKTYSPKTIYLEGDNVVINPTTVAWDTIHVTESKWGWELTSRAWENTLKVVR